MKQNSLIMTEAFYTWPDEVAPNNRFQNAYKFLMKDCDY